eukprot:scaffold735_cov376-Prasinococcus_capsulatus_cf.AAC.26
MTAAATGDGMEARGRRRAAHAARSAHAQLAGRDEASAGAPAPQATIAPRRRSGTVDGCTSVRQHGSTGSMSVASKRKLDFADGDKYVLGIDGGTESLRATIFDKHGKALGTGVAPYATIFPKPSWAEQDPQAWWKALRSTRSPLGKHVSGSSRSAGLCPARSVRCLSTRRAAVSWRSMMRGKPCVRAYYGWSVPLHEAIASSYLCSFPWSPLLFY